MCYGPYDGSGVQLSLCEGGWLTSPICPETEEALQMQQENHWNIVAISEQYYSVLVCVEIRVGVNVFLVCALVAVFIANPN